VSTSKTAENSEEETKSLMILVDTELQTQNKQPTQPRSEMKPGLLDHREHEGLGGALKDYGTQTTRAT
jgi:hypothetical protein